MTPAGLLFAMLIQHAQIATDSDTLLGCCHYTASCMNGSLMSSSSSSASAKPSLQTVLPSPEQSQIEALMRLSLSALHTAFVWSVAMIIILLSSNPASHYHKCTKPGADWHVYTMQRRGML